MDNATLKNIIRFSFNFHQTMGISIHEADPGYIIEKWRKYFGNAMPKPIPDSRHVHIKYDFSKWVEKWGEGSYTEMSKYLSIIHSINTRSFIKYDAEHIKFWMPHDLIDLFERSTEDLSSVPEYRGLHTLVEAEVERWLNEEEVRKEMMQLSRESKIEELLNF